MRQPIGRGVVFVEVTPVFVEVDFGRVVEQIEQVGAVGYTLGIGRVPDSILDESYVFLAIQHRNRFGFVFGRKLRRNSETRLALATGLGGNQKYTIGAGRTINSGRSSIFQYFDAFNIVGREVQHSGIVVVVGRREVETVVDIGRIGYAVNHNQRIGTGIQRGGTTNTDRTAGTWVATRQNIHTGQTTLQGFFHRSYRGKCHDVVHLDTFGGCRLFAHGDTHFALVFSSGRNHHIAKRLSIFAHHHFQAGLSGVRNALGFHTDIREYQGQLAFTFGNAEAEFTVIIRHRTFNHTVLTIVDRDIYADGNRFFTFEHFIHMACQNSLCRD